MAAHTNLAILSASALVLWHFLECSLRFCSKGSFKFQLL